MSRIVAITVAYTGTKYLQIRTGSTRTAYGPTTDAGNAPSHSQGSRRQSTAVPSAEMTTNVIVPAVEAKPSDIVVIATDVFSSTPEMTPPSVTTGPNPPEPRPLFAPATAPKYGSRCGRYFLLSPRRALVATSAAITTTRMAIYVSMTVSGSSNVEYVSTAAALAPTTPGMAISSTLFVALLSGRHEKSTFSNSLCIRPPYALVKACAATSTGTTCNGLNASTLTATTSTTSTPVGFDDTTSIRSTRTTKPTT